MAINRLIVPNELVLKPHEDAGEALRIAFALGVIGVEEFKPGGYNLTPATYADSIEDHRMVVRGPHDATYTITPKLCFINTHVQRAQRMTEPISNNISWRSFRIPEDRDLMVITTRIPGSCDRRIWDAILYTSKSVV